VTATVAAAPPHRTDAAHDDTREEEPATTAVERAQLTHIQLHGARLDVRALSR
jgi:hypothetical protein